VAVLLEVLKLVIICGVLSGRKFNSRICLEVFACLSNMDYLSKNYLTELLERDAAPKQVPGKICCLVLQCLFMWYILKRV